MDVTTTPSARGTSDHRMSDHRMSDHRMSDNELRKAVKVMQSRADDARKRGDEDDAVRIERTVRDYQDEMTRRL